MDRIDPYVDFSEYDNMDPCDYDNDNNRNEPDGVVDFIFIIFRFNLSSLTDTNTTGLVQGEGGYSGIACLGGHSKKFGDSTFITRDSVKISADFPGSGCISDMYHKWDLGVPSHEFGLHYGWGGHRDGFGSHNISGGGIACSEDRSWYGWTSFGNVYEPTTNTDSIVLRDYVTTGDYIKITRPGKVWYLENRRRLNYYSSNNFHSWRWTLNEPLFPNQAYSGLMIYKRGGGGGDVSVLQHAYGKWDWETCNSDTIFKITKTPFFNQFLPKNVNRYIGNQIIDLSDVYVKDPTCNTITNPYNFETVNKTSFIYSHGDSNTFFDVGYNTVYSPWSNPGFQANIIDSLTIELKGRNYDGSLIVGVYFTNIPQASPSKPQFLKTAKHVISPGQYYAKLSWLRNKEPDMSTYGIYKATTNTPGEDAVYSWIGSTSDTTYLDQSIVLYDLQTRYGGICPAQPITFSYRVTAIDLTDKESVMSDRDSISGYQDPCVFEEEGLDNLSNENISFKNGVLQNFPNPFNPSTTLQFSVEKFSHVTLKVYDVLGREISTLVNEFKDPGVYFTTFNGTNVSSGIYYYKLIIGDYVKIKKMLLLK